MPVSCKAQGGGVPNSAAPPAPSPPGRSSTSIRALAATVSRSRARATRPSIDQPKLASLGDQRLRLTISSGKGKMPAFGGINTAQVDSLITYLKATA